MNLPWTGVWAPIWVLDALVFWVLLVGALIGPQAPPEGACGRACRRPKSAKRRGESRVLIAVRVGVGAAGAAGLEGEYKDDWPARVLNFLWFCANLLFQIFLTLKLDGNISWTW